jgi:hypothetical protein
MIGNDIIDGATGTADDILLPGSIIADLLGLDEMVYYGIAEADAQIGIIFGLGSWGQYWYVGG